MTYASCSTFELGANLCFAGSRRLLGANRFCDGAAALLTTGGPRATDGAAFQQWAALADRCRRALGWREGAPIVHAFGQGAELVLPCPPDRCFTACEIAEYAWEAISAAAVPAAPGAFERLHPFADEHHAMAHFRRMDALEREPLLGALRARAASQGVPCLIDDEAISFGEGEASRCYARRALPAVEEVPWSTLRAIRMALVTGSNGKTTTTRLIAAMLAAQVGPAHVALSSTDGVAIGGEFIAQGDYSGPVGARLVLRDPRVKAAVLETARGGILRRGLAVASAQVAVVTNVSADHLGEYGVESLDDIADAKLTVARVLGRDGTLVINAEDATLAPRIARQVCKVACFALDDEHALLRAARATGRATCGARGGVLWLSTSGEQHRLGPIADLPLALGGAATYNVMNMAAAALAASALGVAPADIARVLARFGASNADNPGRLERWNLGGVTVLMDYAHNPDGLARLLAAARSMLGAGGALRLLLGQAGNRADADIAALARVAARAAPATVALKELPGYARGRDPAAVVSLLDAALQAAGIGGDAILRIADERAAAIELVRRAQPGDVVVLPVHQKDAQTAVRAFLDGAAA